MARACIVNEQGELKCGVRDVAYKGDYEGTIRPAIQNAVPTIPPERADLIMRLIELVLESPLDDACVKTRGDDTVFSVHYLLSKSTPVMLLYRHVPLPGNILAAYDVQQNKFAQAREALDAWTKLTSPC